MATTHFNPPPAKRVKVQSDDSPQPRWLLVPTASRTIQDLLKSLLLRLGLPGISTYDLYLDGAPILPNEDIALVRDGEQLHLRLRHSPTTTPDQSQPSEPHLSATSTPEDVELSKKRKRVLTPEGKRRRNARNRRREKRRRLERRKSKDEDEDPANTKPHDSVELKDPLQIDAAEVQLQQPESHEMGAETNPTKANIEQSKEGSPMTENRTPAMPITKPNGCAEQSQDETEVPDQVMEISIAGTTPGVNSSNERQAQHLPNGNTLKLVSMTVSPSQRDNVPPMAKVPADSGSHHTARPDVPSQKPNPRLSYVCLEKVSIEPLANNGLEKESSEVQNETKSPEDTQNGSVRTPAEESPTAERPPDHARLDRTSGLIHDEITCSPEKRTVEKVPNDAPEKPSSKAKTNPDGNEKQSVGESVKDAKFRGRKKPEVKSAETTRGREGVENNVEITVAITKTNEHALPACKPMEIDNRSVGNSAPVAPIQVADGDETQEGTPAQQSWDGDLSDKLEPCRNVNPRWKRRRAQGKKDNRDRNNSRPDPTPDAPDGEPTPKSQSKGRGQRPDELSLPVQPGQATNAETTSAHVTASEAQSTVCDIIDLVDDDDDDVQSLGNLPVLQPPRATADRSASTSPQTIVVSPVEPQTRDLHTTCDGVEPVNAWSGQASKEGLGANVQSEAGEARQKPVTTGGSRRKPARPTRLNKPESASNNSNDIASASRGTSLQAENLETLKTMKLALVRDLQSGRQEVSAPDMNQTQPLRETPTQRNPEGTKPSSGKGMSNEEARRDVKRQRSTLRGGLSTLEAIRVAKAHAAIRLGTPKDTNGTCLQNREPESSKANEDIRDAPPALDSAAGSVKDTARKKRKRKRGAGKSRRYLTEEQVNRSTFVGHRPETLLPPPELLELSEDAGDLVQSSVVPEVLPDTLCDLRQPYVEPSDEQKEVQPASQDKSLGNGDEELPVRTVAKEANTRDRSQSFNLEESVEEEPSPLIDPQEENNEISEQAPPTAQEVCDEEREHGAGQKSGTDTSGAAYHHPVQSTSVDSFRQDLVLMLQDTTRTLAKVWSKWEACQ